MQKRKQQVDLQKALFEFDMHRQQVDTERLALLAQVHLLADEVSHRRKRKRHLISVSAADTVLDVFHRSCSRNALASLSWSYY